MKKSGIVIIVSFLILFICHCKKDARIPILSTTAISNLTSKTATCGGNINSDGGSAVTERGVCWSIVVNPTIANNRTMNGTGIGSYTSILTGLSTKTNYFVRAYATNANGTAYGEDISFSTLQTLTDKDGNYYDTLTIGTQTWMIADLKTTRYNDSTSIPYVSDNAEWINLITPALCYYENDIVNKTTYGNLYNWYVVETCKICPVGWHVPSNAEWLILINYLGGESVAGGKLKEIGITHWLTPNAGANNESGFTALPSGNRIGVDGSFYSLGTYACYWSSDPSGNTQALNRVLVFDGTNFRIGFDNKTAGFSIRCVKD